MILLLQSSGLLLGDASAAALACARGLPLPPYCSGIPHENRRQVTTSLKKCWNNTSSQTYKWY